MNCSKYNREYFLPPCQSLEWTKKEYIDKAPDWCSVDLRDGNQALIIPMTLEDKLEYFTYLVKIGFKEIEIGFPAASDTEYEFCRALIERDLIPDDVTVQVLTQAREHIIKKTFQALDGCKKAIVHLYNSTSAAQREQVFKKTPDEIVSLAVSGARMLKEYRDRFNADFRFEYSPESFTGTEPDFALRICNAVINAWQPTEDNKVIINLPVTVSLSLPHIYASQVEYMCKKLAMRDNVIVSIHPHNDRGCAVADTELAILAGAQRVEGTLFGNGERTGNVDIITLALNMYSHGIDPKLDFSDMPQITREYEKLTGMHVYERQPYSGQLVFAAFSGSHQDAIAKAMHYREQNNLSEWNVPYLPIDPRDIGREYEADVIRINSQSGKGGIGYILESRFGINMPQAMRESFGYLVKGISDKSHKELLPDDIYKIFNSTYVNKCDKLDIPEAHYKQENNGITASVTVTSGDKSLELTGFGNGRLDAVSTAVKSHFGVVYHISSYAEHALESSSKSKAVAYVGITDSKGVFYWGVGIHTDIINASVKALVSAINNSAFADEICARLHND